MSRLTIFEGPDGSGKTTAARRLAGEAGAEYVHLGPFPGVEDLAAEYLAAMRPALDGRHDVVMDRSWLSEPIYGRVHRGGADRVGPALARELEAAARAAASAVVLCLTDWPRTRDAFRARRGAEMLDREEQLYEVRLTYALEVPRACSLPVVAYDYARHPWADLMTRCEERRTAGAHV